MQKILIPTDRATQKYWQSCANSQTIDPSKFPQLMAQLICHAFAPPQNRLQPPSDSQPIQLLISHKFIREFVETDPVRVAAIMSDVFRDNLFNYAHARYSLGLPYKQAIIQYCQLSNIDVDVDINLDALERQFRRKCEKIYAEKQNYFRDKQLKNVLTLSHKISGYKSHEKTYTDEQLNQIVKAYLTEHEGLFYTKTGEERKHLHKQLKIYVYHEIGQRHYRFMMSHFRISKRALYHSINTFRSFLLTAPPVMSV